MKKNKLLLVGLIAVLAFTQIAVTSPNVSSYDPWIDTNDDGIIDIIDLQALASIYGTLGEAINKTALILELEARLDSLNASLLTGYYNKSDSDDRFVNVPGDTMTGALTAPLIYDSDNTAYYVNPAGGTSAVFAGDVGIGTTIPYARLHATGGSVGVRGEGSSYGGYFMDTHGTSRVYLAYADYGVYSNLGTKNYFAGDVGIGTTSPTATLHATGGTGGVRGEGSSYGGYFEDTDNTGYAYLGYGDYGVRGVGSTMGGHFIDAEGTSGVFLGYGIWGVYTSQMAYFGGNVGIGDTDPGQKLCVEGYVWAWGYITGDIVFEEDGKKLWRMFEEEDGLYLESLKTGKVYSFVLQEVDSERLVESNNLYLKPFGVHANITEGVVGLVIALGLAFGLTRYRAKNSKEELDAQQTTLSQWQ